MSNEKDGELSSPPLLKIPPVPPFSKGGTRTGRQGGFLTPVTLTSRAIAHIKKQIAKKGSGTALRLSTKPTGCTGWSYVVEIVEIPHEQDHIFQVENGLSVYVDSTSYPLVKGTEIDYVEEGMRTRFVFNNPNVKDLCGCGESFNV